MINKNFLKNEIIITSNDELDNVNSSSSLWSGNGNITSYSASYPSIITTMYFNSASDFLIGSNCGIWHFDGNKWTRRSLLPGSSFVYYIKKNVNNYLIAGTNDGLWVSSDNGYTWSKSAIFQEPQLSYLTGSLRWGGSSSYRYEIFGKNKGFSFVLYTQTNNKNFRSDHLEELKDAKIYSIFQGIFYRVNTETGQKTTHDSIIILSDNGLWLCYYGSRRTILSAFLIAREPLRPSTDPASDQRYIISSYDENNNPVYQKLRFFAAFQDSRPKSVPLILLTNDGIRVVRNWRWVDPVSSDEGDLYFVWEAAPLATNNISERVICNCYATGIDETIDNTSSESWKKYKCFIGTNKGVFRSYNGCYSVEPCERIDTDINVYKLEYINNTLYAATNKGIFTSTNDGDDWEQLSIKPGNVNYPRDNRVAQIFTPEYNTIDKIALYLHPEE